MKRLLIVEDEEQLALMLKDLLTDAGYEVQHAFDLAGAEAIVARTQLDAAILDVKLDGELVFPLARKLDELGVPYLFASAARRIDIPAELRWQPLIGKPYAADQLITALRALCGDIYSPDSHGSRKSGEHPAI